MTDYSKIRGFNYQPGYAATTVESWRNFNAYSWETELRRGKEFFPGINAIRLWLDWTAHQFDPKGFMESFETALDLVDRICSAKAVVCLFNRWHTSQQDAGGIYIEHFMPKWGWLNDGTKDIFLPYMDDIISRYRSDPRILIWDICNEPFPYTPDTPALKEVWNGEFQWLKGLYGYIKEKGAAQDVGISIYPSDREALELVEPIQDVLLVHPYYTKPTHDEWIKLLDDYEDVSRISGKPLLITECCWGSTDDMSRAEFIKTELSEFSRRGIGFIAHALHHTLLADLHDPQYGPVGGPGNLMFIGPDGKLRTGHGVYNDY